MSIECTARACQQMKWVLFAPQHQAQFGLNPALVVCTGTDGDGRSSRTLPSGAVVGASLCAAVVLLVLLVLAVALVVARRHQLTTIKCRRRRRRGGRGRCVDGDSDRHDLYRPSVPSAGTMDSSSPGARIKRNYQYHTVGALAPLPPTGTDG